MGAQGKQPVPVLVPLQMVKWAAAGNLGAAAGTAEWAHPRWQTKCSKDSGAVPRAAGCPGRPGWGSLVKSWSRGRQGSPPPLQQLPPTAGVSPSSFLEVPEQMARVLSSEVPVQWLLPWQGWAPELPPVNSSWTILL